MAKVLLNLLVPDSNYAIQHHLQSVHPVRNERGREKTNKKNTAVCAYP